MPSFPSGAIERLPWKDLQPQVVSGDTRMSGHFAMSPLSRSLQRLRQQWSACEEWERYEQMSEDARARIRFRRPIMTPAFGDSCGVADGSFPKTPFLKEGVGAWSESLMSQSLVTRSSEPVAEEAVVFAVGLGAEPLQVSGAKAPTLAPKRGGLRVTGRVGASVGAHGTSRSGFDTQGEEPPASTVSDIHYRYREIYNEYIETRIRNL